MGTAVEVGRRHGGDRFYDASRARRGYHHHGLPKARWAPAVHQEKAAEEPEPEPSPSPARAPVPPPGVVAGNLERFVAAVTPFVPAQYPSKRAAKGWRGCGVDAEREAPAPHFFLRDAWESYREWSAYGAGVPLVLDGRDGVVQYYVPYLSAIQLYGDPAVLRVSSGPRHMMDDSDGEYHDSSSDTSSDYELGRVKHLTQEGFFSSDDSESGDLHGRLLFQYLEFDSPFCREPLTDKISSLSARFPGLRTLRSCDLSPRSWMSVAWYPIYRIPTGPTLKDLDACFLTFHRLSTGPEEDHGGAVKYWGPATKHTIPLSVFGMASYKFSNSIWSSTDGDRHLASFLQQAASDWLRDSRTSHPDYQFFASRGAYHR